jgi:hypothetical protein
MSTPCKHVIGIQVQLHSHLTSGLDAGEWLTSRQVAIPLVKNIHTYRIGGWAGQSGRFREDKRILPLPGFEPRIAHHEA